MASRVAETSGQVRGTPAYMAPECWDGVILPASDVYAWGIMAYLLLTGTLPFRVSINELAFAHLQKSPKPLRSLAPNCPQDIAELITHCLSKDPNDRPQNGGELLRRLGPTEQTIPGNFDAALPKQSLFFGSRLDAGTTAIAYSANTRFVYGGGVSGVVHKAAGAGLIAAEKAILGPDSESTLQAGVAFPTAAFDLEKTGIRRIYHAVTLYWNSFSSGYSRTHSDAYLEDISSAVEDTCRQSFLDPSVKSLAIPLMGLRIGLKQYSVSQKQVIAANVRGLWRFRLKQALAPSTISGEELERIRLTIFDSSKQTLR
ncbi:MAG: protein kinase, partial [Planctomycetota bacterium]|nr:protein kinase [Planctomycetota bacterium]